MDGDTSSVIGSFGPDSDGEWVLMSRERRCAPRIALFCKSQAGGLRAACFVLSGSDRGRAEEKKKTRDSRAGCASETFPTICGSRGRGHRASGHPRSMVAMVTGTPGAPISTRLINASPADRRPACPGLYKWKYVGSQPRRRGKYEGNNILESTNQTI